jgi:hypothetical protein
MFRLRPRAPERIRSASRRPTGDPDRTLQGYPGYVYPADHVLPQGGANRGDELLWVETAVARHADAGTLDAGNPFILDAEIDQRCRQWASAVDEEAEGRARTARDLQAAVSACLVTQAHELRRLRELVAAAKAEDDHWRQILLGGPVGPPPAAPPGPVGLRPATEGVVITDLSWGVEPAPHGGAVPDGRRDG